MAKRNASPKKVSVESKAGIKNPGVHTGKVDPVRAKSAAKESRIQRIASGQTNGMFRDAGMMMSNSSNAMGTLGSGSLPAFRTSYASGNTMTSGAVCDIPPYFQIMNDKNGGLIYWPVTLREKYEWYRYWARCIYLSDKDLGEVLMSDGTTKSIRDVVVGDEVVTGVGTIRRVKEKFERRCVEDKAVTIKAWCLQNHLKTTHHHPYWVVPKEDVIVKGGNSYKQDIEFNPKWVHAEHVRHGDYVLLAPVEPDNNSEMTKEQARFLGYYAAEGSLIWGSRCVGMEEGKGWTKGQMKIKVPVGVSFTINKSEENTLGDGILRMAKNVFGVDGRIVHERGNSVEIVVNGREIGEFCFYHVGVYSEQKKLSSELVMSSNECRKEFLVGYMEGDGCQYEDDKNRGKIVIGTSSPMLASQVQMMAVSAGVMCRIAKYKRKPNSGFNSSDPKTDQWHITIPSWSANALVNTSDKWSVVETSEDKHCAFFVGGYAAFKVREVLFTEEDDTVYNIEVDADGDEKSFICNGMITHNTDAFIGRGLELLADLPMSRISLNMPKMEKKKKLRDEIHAFFSAMCEDLGLFKRLQDGLWEYNLIGNVYLYHEWNQKKKRWDRIVILPPEEVSIFQYPYQDNARVEYRPEKLMQLIKTSFDGISDLDPVTKEILAGIPKEIVEMVNAEDCIVMDSTPMIDGKAGSFVYHMARRRSPYMDLGASVLERVLVPMLMKEHFRYTQLGLASRNMTPKNKISAPNLTQPELDDLRLQLDLSYMDPDYSIVTNYDWDWEQIGADGRLLDLQGEYEMIENQVFASMGVTRELMTGEGTWSGNRITIEIINSMFLLTREMLREYVENYLFRPVAVANGWFEEDKNGVREYYYPKLGFNRLSIRDNAEVFDSLFQLYQKGSLPVDVIYELFNLDSDSLHEKMKNEVFTIKDSTFNRLLEGVNGDLGSRIAEGTDVLDRVVEYLGLKKVAPPPEEGGDGMGGEEPTPEGESGDVAPENGDEQTNESAQDDEDDGGFDLSDLDDILVDDGSEKPEE
jgi:intein/homing endonuclease